MKELEERKFNNIKFNPFSQQDPPFKFFPGAVEIDGL